MSAKGIDVSLYQGHNLNWEAIEDDGISFAFLRASTGFGIDASYRGNFDRARSAGILLGAYHYLYPPSVRAINEQVNMFVQMYDPTSELPAILDVEQYGLNEGMVYQFLTMFETITGRIPGIYTSQYKWHSLVGRNKTWASRYPLWIAHYTSANQPLIPDAWQTWTFWQYTSSGSVSNHSGRIDMNRYHGTESELYAAYAKKIPSLEERVTKLEERVDALENQHEI